MIHKEYINLVIKANELKTNRLYKLTDVNGNYNIFKTLNEAAIFTGLKSASNDASDAYKSGKLYRNYYWNIIEPFIIEWDLGENGETPEVDNPVGSYRIQVNKEYVEPLTTNE